MAGFTARASDTSPEDLVHFLNSVYTRIDNIVERHSLEKIKTSGYAYMVVSGVPEALPDHACAIADLALDIRDALSGARRSQRPCGACSHRHRVGSGGCGSSWPTQVFL